MQKIFSKIVRRLGATSRMEKRLEHIQLALGRVEGRQTENEPLQGDLKNIEFKVFSQWGEDGILWKLINSIEIQRSIFVEFGVQDYTESNTRFLIENNNWSGLVIDGSPENIAYIKNDDIYWRHNLKACCEFITKENINNILTTNGIEGDIGLLSIDIDGNDYWVWEAITCIKPRIVVSEYNSIFGKTASVTVPYNNVFVRNTAHYSNIYYGASISALNSLASKKGYRLVGSNSAGNNLFFVREDVGGHIPLISTENAYVKSKFREARSKEGALLHITSEEGIGLIRDEILIDLNTKQEITVYDALKS